MVEGFQAMVIRPAVAADSHGIALEHVSTWQYSYRGIVPQAHLDQLSVADRERRWTEILERDSSETLVAETGGEVVGFISFGKSRQERAKGEGEVYAIYVIPSRWSRGFGRSLWSSAMPRLRDLGFVRTIVWVLAANERAIRFYERAGFTLCNSSEKTVEIGGKYLPEVSYGIAIA